MKNKAEENVSTFYNTIGWETEGEITEDAKRYEDLREYASEYVSKCRLRVLNHIPASGENILDMASGPIQYKEYLEFSKNYAKRYCVDLSSTALEAAKRKIGDRGVFLCGSFFDIDLQKNFFDCTISLHTIYHIDRAKQEEAVRKLIAVTKPGKPIIIVYSNPNTIIKYLEMPFHLFKFRRIAEKLGRLFNKKGGDNSKGSGLHFYAHPLKWWDQFNDAAEIEMFPWRAFAASHQKALIPNNKFGKKIFDRLFKLEERYPRFFVRHFQYPMIVLTKRNIQ